jgi:hypothetical protein
LALTLEGPGRKRTIIDARLGIRRSSDSQTAASPRR